MRKFNIFRSDLIKKIKSDELSKDWKKLVAMMGVGTFLLTPTFLMGCKNNSGVSEAVEQPPEVEKPEEEMEVEEVAEESSAINREEIGEEEFLIELWDIVNYENYQPAFTGRRRDEQIEDFAINFEHFKNLAHETLPFYYFEDFQNPETGEKVKIKDLIEEHGEYWGPIMYAREMTRDDKAKIAIFINYSIAIQSIGEPYNDIRHAKDLSFTEHFLFENAFEKYGSLRKEENPFEMINVPSKNYREMLDQIAIRNAGNANHFFAMPYLTPSRKSTTMEPRTANLQALADDQLAIMVGFQLGLFKMQTEILEEMNVDFDIHIQNIEFFEKINRLNIDHYRIHVDYEF